MIFIINKWNCWVRCPYRYPIIAYREGAIEKDRKQDWLNLKCHAIHTKPETYLQEEDKTQ